MARVLVMEKEAIIALQLRELLRGAGHAAKVVKEDDCAALELLGEDYDVLITSLATLRNCDSHFLEDAACVATGEAIKPVVVISGEVSLDVRDRLREMGIGCFLTKPFDDAALLGAVEWALKPQSIPSC